MEGQEELEVYDTEPKITQRKFRYLENTVKLFI